MSPMSRSRRFGISWEVLLDSLSHPHVTFTIPLFSDETLKNHFFDPVYYEDDYDFLKKIVERRLHRQITDCSDRCLRIALFTYYHYGYEKIKLQMQDYVKNDNTIKLYDRSLKQWIFNIKLAQIKLQGAVCRMEYQLYKHHQPNFNEFELYYIISLLQTFA